MVALNSQEERDRIGINSLERALVYAFSMLRTSIVEESNKGVADQRIKIGENITSIEDASLVLEAKLNYNSFLVNQSGGYLILYIEELAETTPYSTEIYCLNNNEQVQPIPKTPNQIKTLEQYLFWSAASLLASSSPEDRYIEIKKFEHNQDGAYVQIKAKIPFNYKGFLLGGNYICSVQRISTFYREFQFPQLSSFDNSSVIDNDFILSN